MSMIRKSVGVLFLSAAVAVGLTGCPDEVFEDECLEDAECEDGEICYGEDGEQYEPLTCIAECDPEDEDACAAGEYCIERDDGAGAGETICLGQPDECTSNEDCLGDYECVFPEENGEEENGDENGENGDEENGDEATGVCELPEDDGYYTVRIEDFTDPESERGQQAAYDFETAGLNVYNIALLEGDAVVSHATASEFRPGENLDFSSEADAFEIFDGEDPGFDNMCPDIEDFDRPGRDEPYASSYNPHSVLSLGAGGELFVHFEDEDGEAIALTEDHTVQVYVYGETCSVEYANEAWGDGFAREIEDCDDDVFHEPDTLYYCRQDVVDPHFVDICSDWTTTGFIEDTSCDRTLPIDGETPAEPSTEEVGDFDVTFEFEVIFE